MRPDSSRSVISSRWRKFALMLLGIALLLTSFTLYLQTRHAFMHVIVPLVASFVPGQIDIEHGSLTFPGMIQLAGLSYQAPNSGLSIRINRLFLRVSALALVRDRELFVEDLAIEQGDIRIATEPAPARQDSQATQPSGKVTILVLPWAVQRMQLNDMTVSIRTEGNEFTAENMSVAAREIGPRRSGTVELRGNISLNRPTDQTRWAGGLILNGTIEQSPDRYQIKWNATNEVTVREWPGKGKTIGSEPIAIHHALSGFYDVAKAMVHHDSSVTLRYGTQHLGELSFGMTRTRQPVGAIMDVGLVIKEISSETLNLVLTDEKPFRLRSDHLGGHVNIHGEGDRYIISSAITGRQLQIVSDTEVTPPLDIDIIQSGIVDLGSNNLTFDRFQLRAAENDQIRLTGELERPLIVRLGSDGMDSENSLVQTSSEGNGVFTIRNLDVPEVRQWLHVFGLDRLQGIRAGQFNGSVAISSRNKGRSIDVKGTLTISDLLMDGSERGATHEPITFAHEFHGTVSDLSTLELKSWTIRGAIRNQVKGAVTLAGTVNLKDPMANPSLKGSLGLADLPGAMLNPVLARWTDTRIGHSQLNGAAHVEVTGETVTWNIKLGGRQIALWLPKSRETTIPLDIDLAQRGSLDWATGTLQLDEATVRVFERSRPVIKAALNKPVRLPLPGKAGDQTRPRLDSQPADFNLGIDRLGFYQLRSRLSLWNISALDHVKTGYIDAKLAIHWKGLSEPTSASGYLNITDLRVDTGTIHLREPLRVKTRFDATVSEFSRIQIKKLALRASTASALLAETELSGSANANDASMNLALLFNSMDVPGFLTTLGVLDEQQLKLFSRGKIEAEGRVVSRGPNHPLSVQVKAHARELQFQPLLGQFLSYTLMTQGDLEVIADHTAIEFKPIELTLQERSGEAGTLSIKGNWPIAPTASRGSIRLIAKNLDVGPLAQLSEAFPGLKPGPLPIKSDIIVTLDPESEALALHGGEYIGPIHVTREDGGPRVATLRIEHDLTRDKNMIRVSSLSLTADRPQGVPDNITASAQVRLTGKQGGHLTGNIASLDAGWYAALFSTPQSSPPTDRKRTVATQPAAKQNSSQSPGVLLGLDTDMTIGSISYGKLTIGPGRLTSQETGDRRQVKLEPTGFAAGKIEATVELDLRTGRNDFTWTGKGDALNIEKILQAIEPGEVARAKGTGSFTTSGRGLLHTGSLQQHLDGTFDFVIKDGKFLRSQVLKTLAQYTHLDALEHMGFDGLQGKITMKDGWIRTDPVSATGSVATLDGNIALSPTNIVDGKIFAKVGPSLSKSIRIPCMSALLKTPDGFTALPLAVTLKGPLEDISYSVDTAGWKYTKGALGAFADTMMNLVQGCREEHPEADAQSDSRNRPTP